MRIELTKQQLEALGYVITHVAYRGPGGTPTKLREAFGEWVEDCQKGASKVILETVLVLDQASKTLPIAKMVLHHDDPPCSERLNRNGICPKCGFYPDMQSLALHPYCPNCDVQLVENKCPKCGQFFELPKTGG